MITIRRQSAVQAQMPTIFQHLAGLRAANTRLRSASWVDSHKHAPGAFSLVREHEEKVRPPSIVDGLGEHSSCQPFDIQIFHRDQPVLVNNSAGFFVMKVAALITNVVVKSLQQENRFAPPIGSFLHAGNTSLQSPEFDLCGSKPSWILNHASIAKRGEPIQSDIDANGVRAEGQRTRFALDGEQRKPATSLAFDRERLYNARQGARELKADVAYLGYLKLRPVKPPASRSECETVIPARGFESRVSRLFPLSHTTKERLECQVNALQNVLKGVCAYIGNVRPDRADLFHLIILIKPADAFALQSPRIASLLQRSVIKLSTSTEMGHQRDSLSASGIDPIANDSDHDNLILSRRAA